ncbi:MAG TPA: prolyl oligopeptidase family serine peptidase [Acidimicrobiia bacterium]|nr:prolyl oligopeptidase family serine peptidase [Acidimicrobiia bacterium]
MTPLDTRRRRGAVVGVLLWLAGCSAGSEPGSAPPSTAPASASTPAVPRLTAGSVGEYLPGLEARFFPGTHAGRAALLVMVPGGGWETADPAGLDGLARLLADSGIFTATVEVRAGEDEVLYPVPVEDVLCAVAFVVTTARSEGVELGPLIVLGHSTGAHLAALAVLAAADYAPACADPVVAPDALIGMAGTYDVGIVPDMARRLFGVSAGADPALWESGNPVLRAGLRPEVPVLLIHGDADDLVPLSFTTEFAAALERGGHPVTVEILTGADHHDVYSAGASGALIADWTDQLG